ncbi:uncharacterized protein LOC114534585, partial [Dendronephthya gigantea]|uniref:uncharacterized protein LOC114534585 n=1 Tax=Dendronephthya gigantea TaxID=151771 RepID=UPI00106A32C3
MLLPQDVSVTAFEVCIKDLPGLIGNHEPITVDYSAVGDLDPCLYVTCKMFAVCRAFGPYDARCVCVTDCPSVEQNLCASNGQTFNNVCLFQLKVCQTKANYTIYHRGSCRDFPITRGRRYVADVPNWSRSHCQTVKFDLLSFYPDKPVHVQISVSHVNDSGQVHEAAVSWVEDVSDTHFKFCVMESGRNEGPPHGFATVEYMAYQGAPSGGLAGSMLIPEWWTGSKQKEINQFTLPKGSFSSTPTVLATAEHHRLSLKHDAASLWLEDVTRYSFKVCMRELQNFDGPHQDIYVNWIAFETLERPIFTEQGSNHFVRTSKNPSSSTNYAQCKDVTFAANYTKPPTVLVSPKHNTSGNNVDPKNNGISTWIETITDASFRICFKELHSTNGYDPVTISHVVLGEICDSGWIYFGGYCYKIKTSCETWKNASTTCMGYGSTLARIENSEQDVFVQNLHYGKQPSWIGLNDQANEGIYLWSDGGPASYTYWDPQVPTPHSETEDCVEISGKDTKYHWQSSSCDNCRGYTCMKDYDECTQNTHACDPNADCENTDGSYTCQCRSGFTGNGKECTDVNECSLNFCAPSANCSNTVGSYTCYCRKGYTGNGRKCRDVDECSINIDGLQSCDSNADCSNTAGSYICRCRSGYEGDGFSCLVSCGNPGYPRNGYARGSTYTEGSTVTFRCD